MQRGAVEGRVVEGGLEEGGLVEGGAVEGGLRELGAAQARAVELRVEEGGAPVGPSDLPSGRRRGGVARAGREAGCRVELSGTTRGVWGGGGGGGGGGVGGGWGGGGPARVRWCRSGRAERGARFAAPQQPG